MTEPFRVKTRGELWQEWVRRLVTNTSGVSWFGTNSVIAGWGRATAALAEGVHQAYVALIRRKTLSAATDAFLAAIAAELGTPKRGSLLSGVFVVFQPITANVSVINIAAAPGFDDIVVDDGSDWLVADEGRLRSADGLTTEVWVVAAKPAPNTIRVATLANAYLPGAEDVDILFRALVPVGTLVRSRNGVVFATTTEIHTGDANPVLDGETTAISLADKTWAEATTSGSSGNIDPLSADRLSTPIRGVRAVLNPARGIGGADEEPDHDLRYRAGHWPAITSQDTAVAIEALCMEADSNVLRAINTSSSILSTLTVTVVHRGGASFNSDQLEAINTYVGQRLRSGLTVKASNATLTSVSVEAAITLDPLAEHEQTFRAIATRLAVYIDLSRWAWGLDPERADLLVIVRQTPGVASVDSTTFLPATSPSVGVASLPTLSNLSVQDTASGLTIGAALSQSF